MNTGWFKKGHKVSSELKKKVSETMKGRTPWNKGLKGWRAGEKHPWMPTGENHWNYKKDRDSIDLNKRRYWSKEYKNWRDSVFARDNWKCKINNDECSAYVEAHHILRWNDYPELRFNINNGITLCRVHHPRKMAEEKRLIPYFTELVSVSK